MHAPGTMKALFGAFAIRYFVKRDDLGETVVFLRVRLR